MENATWDIGIKKKEYLRDEHLILDKLSITWYLLIHCNFSPQAVALS